MEDAGVEAWDAAAYRTAINESLEAMLVASPVWATWAGDHRFDDQWPELETGAEARVAADFGARAQGLRAIVASVPQRGDPAACGTDRPALDAQLLADRLEGQAFVLSERRPLESDPSYVLGIVGNGITTLTTHPFASKHDRMNSLAARLAKVPALLAAARARLRAPSRAGLESVAIVGAALGRMLRDDVAKTEVGELEGDAPLADRLKKAANGAAAGIEAYAAEIAKTFPEQGAKDAPLGAEKWAMLARLNEGVSESPGEVRTMGEAELARLEKELDSLIVSAGALPPSRSETTRPEGARAAFFKRLEAETPSADKVLEEYRVVNAGVERWLRGHPFATVPWEEAKLEIVPSPPARRSVSFASMNAAGPLETISDARFEVNTPDAHMPPARRAALLSFHARGAIDSVSIHEALPGHYLQILHQRRSPSKVRKLLWASTTGEGWAHYCEQAVLDAGYTGADAVRTRAFYLRMALQRAARVVIDVAENDGSMSLDQGTKFMMEHAFLAPEAARIEARRAMLGPANPFAYTYGKLAIIKLRERARAKEGAAFDLVRFHDRLLAVGAVPVRYLAPVLGLD
jgi:uncharacterized protein (DUF885 family)